MNWFLNVMTKYADFNGRARRKEYWMFTLFNSIFAFAAIFLDNILEFTFGKIPYGPIYVIYVLAVFLPSLAVSVRRLHDIGKSGYMILVSFIPFVGTIWLLVLMATESSSEDNEYGEIPKMISNEKKETERSNGDIIILISVIWMFVNRIFWVLVTRLGSEFYNYDWFRSVSTVINIIWAFIPLALAFAVKDNTKRVILFILGGLYIVFDLFSFFSQYIF